MSGVGARLEKLEEDLQRIEEDLQRILELPVAQRVAPAAEFLEKAQRLVMGLCPLVAAHAERVLAKYGLSGHGDDVASLVVWKALGHLKKQLADKSALPWRRPMSMTTWLLVIHGKPFQGTESGVITNYIRKMKRFSPISVSELPENGDVFIDDRVADAESALILKQGQQLIEEALKELTKSKPRNVFIFRMRTGMHRFQTLDPDTLIALARDLKMSRAECTAISTIAKLKNIGSDSALEAETIGALTGLQGHRVRQIVQEVITWITAWVARSQPGPAGSATSVLQRRRTPKRMLGSSCRPSPLNARHATTTSCAILRQRPLKKPPTPRS